MAPITCRRGEIYRADLNPVAGRKKAGGQPVLVIQNDTGNRYGDTTIVAPLVPSLPAKTYPTEVQIPAGMAGLDNDSSVLLSQVKTIDKRRLGQLVGQLDEKTMRQVDQAIMISLGLVPL